ELSRTFLRTGGCLQAREPSESRLPVSTRSWSWPRGFFWVEPGALGGMPRPGLLAELEQDLIGLTQLGVRVVVGLEEAARVPARSFITRGLDFIHFPVRDMDAPELDPARALCRFVLESMRASKPVAFHCRAGLGRTGTLLAACLVTRGSSASQ